MNKIFLSIVVVVLVSFSFISAEESNKGLELVYIPIVGYKEEASWAFGMAGVANFEDYLGFDNKNQSTLVPFALYTLENQIFLNVNAFLYVDQWHAYADGGLFYRFFPNKYFGTGKEASIDKAENYTTSELKFLFNGYKHINQYLRVGAKIDYERFDISETESGGLLETTNIIGLNGGSIAGLGIGVQWDSRDVFFFPKRGSFFDFSVISYSDIFGSDYKYNEYFLDIRQYFSVTQNDIFAYQIYYASVTNGAPFHRLSLLGGGNVMRGYFQGLYRDLDLLSFQIEYRMPERLDIFGTNVGFVVFWGLGQVEHQLKDFSLETFLPTYGVGMRWPLTTSGQNFRIDFANGKDSTGIVITIQEAF